MTDRLEIHIIIWYVYFYQVGTELCILKQNTEKKYCAVFHLNCNDVCTAMALCIKECMNITDEDGMFGGTGS